MPFGLDPLELAFRRAKRRPIRLLKPELQGRYLLALIAGVARDLQNQIQSQKGKEVILLPIEQLRALLAVRKVVVSGAVLRLMEHGIIEDTGEKYHTGKARQFRFVAREGVDFELAEMT